MSSPAINMLLFILPKWKLVKVCEEMGGSVHHISLYSWRDGESLECACGYLLKSVCTVWLTRQPQGCLCAATNKHKCTHPDGVHVYALVCLCMCVTTWTLPSNKILSKKDFCCLFGLVSFKWANATFLEHFVTRIMNTSAFSETQTSTCSKWNNCKHIYVYN